MTRADQASLLVRKAQQDEAIVLRLIDDPQINDESVGFHVQQAAEKLLKALLVLEGLDYPRSHDLELLMTLLEAADVSLPDELLPILDLSPMATLYRYEELPLDEPLPRQQWPALIVGLRRFVELRLTAG